MLWFFIILVALTFIFNWLTVKHGLEGVSYIRSLSKNMVEIGEEFEIIATIENRKFFPVAFLKITEKFPLSLNYKMKSNCDRIGDCFDHIITLFIMPYQRVKRTYSVSGSERGHYIFRSARLEAGDFIGFKTSQKDVDYLQELVVLPKKIDLDEDLMPFGNYYGDISVIRWIIDDPLMTTGIREYTGNEPEKHIHWPSSLKYNSLMVKNFDFTTDNDVKIILNVECSKPFWVNVDKDKIEDCISLCRGLVEELEHNKIPYNFITNSYGEHNMIENFHAGGVNYYNSTLNALGKVSYGVAIKFEDLIDDIFNRRENFTTFILVTPRIFDPYIEPLNKLITNGNKLILISLEEEKLDKLDSSIIKYIRRIS